MSANFRAPCPMLFEERSFCQHHSHLHQLIGSIRTNRGFRFAYNGELP